ncbi:amyloid fiber anchoring/assembly protein TapA [Bacillus kwashiorkori]|uniref:amyloid fiber anchoring/assembly protein TapA n=1 Tax=Bacillus kwashiorkori TaxID=1522318 RepID=UPI001EEFB072|nr:amyloid fiber anchoring/assembly protein TapA [Bacillus kwashiorkori]
MSRTLRTIKERNFKSLVMLKAAIVFYLFLFIVHYLTTTTTAFFNAEEKTNITLTAGQWKYWDGSNLEIIDQGGLQIQACPAELTITIKNNGNPMEKQSKYEVYYVNNGDPLTEGGPVKLTNNEASIQPLQAEETITITYNAKRSGVYAFLIHQTEEHPEYSTVASDFITVQCEEKQEKSPINEQNKKDANYDGEQGLEKSKENSSEETDKSRNKDNSNQADVIQSTSEEEQSNETPPEQQEKEGSETETDSENVEEDENTNNEQTP